MTHMAAEEVGNYNYGPGHPMKPHRIRMVHSLLVNYGVYRHLNIYVRSPFPSPSLIRLDRGRHGRQPRT